MMRVHTQWHGGHHSVGPSSTSHGARDCGKVKDVCSSIFSNHVHEGQEVHENVCKCISDSCTDVSGSLIVSETLL